MTPAIKLAIVVGIQLAVLLSIVGFKQYTIWTGETVVLRVAPFDPRDPFRGEYFTVRYEISTLNPDALAGDDYADGDVFVEVRAHGDGYWDAVALHDDRERTFDDTELIEGDVEPQRPTARRNNLIYATYGIEEIFIPEGSGDQLPFGDGHTIGISLKVDRFGNAVARHFVVDGEKFDLERD